MAVKSPVYSGHFGPCPKNGLKTKSHSIHVFANEVFISECGHIFMCAFMHVFMRVFMRTSACCRNELHKLRVD